MLSAGIRVVSSTNPIATIKVNANIQALRALAAYGVVIHHIIDSYNHYIGDGRPEVSINIGATGVEIFFVISGYIMSTTTEYSHASPIRFIQNRIVRIVPSYWLLTFLATVAVASGFQLFGISDISAEHLLRSLLFLPEFGPSGEAIRPILFVGWTLEFEMLFYFIFFMSLYVENLYIRRTVIIAALLGLVVFGRLSSSEYANYLFSELLLAFLLGIVIHMFERRLAAPGWAAALMMAISLAGLAFVDLFADLAKTSPGHLVVIAGAALLVLAAVSFERAGFTVGNGFLMQQGDASYAIYLVHPFVLQVVGKLSIVSGMNASAAGLAGTMAAMFLACGICGNWFHSRIDEPLVRFLKQWHSRRRLRNASA